jgi:hypothetical protein
MLRCMSPHVAQGGQLWPSPSAVLGYSRRGYQALVTGKDDRHLA